MKTKVNYRNENVSVKVTLEIDGEPRLSSEYELNSYLAIVFVNELLLYANGAAFRHGAAESQK